MTPVPSPSRPHSRSPRWCRFWWCAWPGSTRWCCRSGVSTPPGRRPVWPPAAMTGWQRRDGSDRSMRWSRCTARVNCWWPGSARDRLCCRGSPSQPRPSRWPSRVADDTGSASVTALAMVTLLLAVTAGVAVLGSVVIARHRAQSAADLAALSAAAWVMAGPQIACTRATSVAHAMRAAVTDCSVQGLDAVITVEAAAGAPGWRASARARAGPAATISDHQT